MKYLAYTWPDRVLLHNDVPLRDVTLERQVNGVPYLEGDLDEATAYDRIIIEGSGRRTVPLIRKQGTLLVAVGDNGEVRSFVVTTASRDHVSQDTVHILAAGREEEPHKTPWEGEPTDYVEEDPLKIHRDIWEHLLGFPDVVPMEVQAASSPIRIGEEERENNFETSEGEEVSFTSGPFWLRPWAEHDLGRIIDDLSESTPFEHRVVTLLDPDDPDAVPEFRLERRYPAFERRELRDLSFELDVNVFTPEEADDEDRDYYSRVVVWGNGEGSRRRRGEAVRPNHDRARATRVVEDQSLTTNAACRAEARRLLGVSRSDRFYDSIVVTDSDPAPLGSFDIGDVIWLKIPQHGKKAHVQKSYIYALTHNVRTGTVTLSLSPAS